MYFTYVLFSKKDNKLYIGVTGDLTKRVKEHNNELVRSTEARLPLKVLYYEACLSKDKAIAREKYFKTNYGRRYLKSRL